MYCRSACGIDLGDSFVVTGGIDGSTWNTVAEYTPTGEVTYLAALIQGRYNHACSKFIDDNGRTVSLKFNIEMSDSYIEDSVGDGRNRL